MIFSQKKEDLKLIPSIQVVEMEKSIIEMAGGMNYTVRLQLFFNDKQLTKDIKEHCFDHGLRDGLGHDGASVEINQSI